MRGAFFFNFDTITIRKDSEGRYCLNDLHKAAGGERRHEPLNWRNTDSFKEMVAELEITGNPVVSKTGRTGGTFVCKELVYAYAMWVSASFNLKVIRVFEEYATKGMVMKPEVAQQAFDDPKVFMAKALMLAQEIKGLVYTNATLSSH